MSTSTISNRQDAFSVLGHPLLATEDAAMALFEGGLAGWNIRKSPAVAHVTDPITKEVSYVPMPGRNAVIYDDPATGQLGFLGDVGDAHVTMQNEDQIEFLNTIRDETGATFETAGITGGGRRVFVTLKLPGTLKIGGVDDVEMYLASINAHDGSMAHTLMVLPNRFACMNMLPLAMKTNSHMVRARHTRNGETRLKAETRRMLDSLFDYLDEWKATAEKLADTSMTQREFDKIITAEFGAADDAPPSVIARAENKIDQMAQLFSANTQQGIQGTAWAGLNAITEYADHYTPVRGGDALLKRAERAVFDSSIKNKALDLMTAYANM